MIKSFNEADRPQRAIGRQLGLVIMLLCASFFFLPSCTNGPGSAQVLETKSSGTRQLLMLSFQDASEIYGENVTVRAPFCGNVFTTGEVAPGAAENLLQHLIDFIQKNVNADLIPASRIQGVIGGILQETPKELPVRELYMETGRILSADAILYGYVYRFRKRNGSEYSADMPASVGFDMDLVRVKDGRLLWSGHFNETQQSLTEDLFQLGTFIKHRGRWITADDLAVYGLEKVLQTFPKP